MTHDYKAALADMPENDGAEDPFHWVCDNYETIRSALKLAQETEQLRKERDEFERKLKDRSEWFFRWIARGKAGYAGMSMEKCADMIWHHPDNPYSENNPWSELAKKVAGE